MSVFIRLKIIINKARVHLPGLFIDYFPGVTVLLIFLSGTLCREDFKVEFGTVAGSVLCGYLNIGIFDNFKGLTTRMLMLNSLILNLFIFWLYNAIFVTFLVVKSEEKPIANYQVPSLVYISYSSAFPSVTSVFSNKIYCKNLMHKIYDMSSKQNFQFKFRNC